MSRAVMISIQPQWCEMIFKGRKTIEVRKTRPKIKTPFKCYIYCTKGGDDLYSINGIVQKPRYMEIDLTKDSTICDLNGSVIGEFVCDYITYFQDFRSYVRADMCMEWYELARYLDGKCGYCWHISDLIIYKKPKDYADFFYPPEKYCEKGLCAKCPKDQMPTPDGDYEFDCEWNRPLKRPPQSWCYVQDTRCEGKGK